MLKINFPKNKYKTIYTDPPWPEQGGGKIKRGADRHYPLMSVKEIMELPVGELADPEGCHLYLWATNNYLPAAFECIKAWGFEYITIITRKWRKAPCFSYGDISHTFVGDTPLSVIKQYIEV